jgi:hypothetical protein
VKQFVSVSERDHTESWNLHAVIMRKVTTYSRIKHVDTSVPYRTQKEIIIITDFLQILVEITFPFRPLQTELSIPQKLALTSPTSGGRSVCIVRSRTHATEFVCLFICLFKLLTV